MPETSTSSLEKMFDEWFVKKAPFQIPPQWRENIAKWSPWITLVVLILMLPAVFLVFGVGLYVGALATSLGAVGPLYWLGFAVLLVQLVLMAISIPGLMKRKKFGWNMVYYGTLISVVYAFVTFIGSFGIYGLLSSLIGDVVSLYTLFQIRTLYS